MFVDNRRRKTFHSQSTYSRMNFLLNAYAVYRAHTASVNRYMPTDNIANDPLSADIYLVVVVAIYFTQNRFPS